MLPITFSYKVISSEKKKTISKEHLPVIKMKINVLGISRAANVNDTSKYCKMRWYIIRSKVPSFAGVCQEREVQETVCSESARIKTTEMTLGAFICARALNFSQKADYPRFLPHRCAVSLSR